MTCQTTSTATWAKVKAEIKRLSGGADRWRGFAVRRSEWDGRQYLQDNNYCIANNSAAGALRTLAGELQTVKGA